MSKDKIDYLIEDPDIPTQRFCCLSFIEPRDSKVLTQKEIFMASRFIKGFVEEYETAKEFASNPNNKITEEIQQKLDLSYQNIFKMYKGYRKTHFTQMSKDFETKHNPTEATTVSGVKVRGSFRTYEEAQTKAQEMRDYEPAVNCFVAQVGYWLPYDPENMEDIKAEFREEQLNKIYGEKQKEIEKSKLKFDERKNKMIEENIKFNEKKKLEAEEAMKEMKKNKTHQEKKEEMVIEDEDSKKKDEKDEKEEDKPKPKKRGRPKKTEEKKKKDKKPKAAKKAGNRRIRKKK